MWHTAWNINDQEKYITFEFNDVVKLTKIKYVRRAYDEDNGTFLNYTVYTKNTEEGEWKASATGAWTWSNPNREQIIEFETPIEAKYVKLQANKTVKDNNFASASEIEFYENIATRPEITSQPQGGYSDSSITLNVEASSNGSSLNYQWYENSENSLFGATEIAGATDSSYVVNLAEGQKKYYFVKVTNAETCVSIISDIVMAGHGTDAAMVNGTAYSDLASAIKAATSGSVVYVLRDQEISSTIPVNKNITIEAEAGTTVVLKRSESFTGDFMFKVQSGANFNVSRTASGKVIIDGGNIVSAYGAVKVENGRFYLNSNGVIRNNNSTSNGAAVYTSAGGSSQIHIYGTITGNRTNGDGGAIYSNGFTYVYASSEISNNHAEYNAGAIYNYSGGVASISGGNHFGNTAVGNGGAVYKSTDNGTGRIDADFTKITFENNKSVVTGENGGTLSNVYVTRSTNLGTIIANATNDEAFYNAGRATISGNAVPGQELSVNVYDSNAEEFTYQWQYSEDGTTFANIEGATASTYRIREEDKNGYLRGVLRDKTKTYAGTIASSSYKGMFEAHLDGQGIIGTTLTAKTNYTAENASFKYVWQRKSAEGDYVNIECQDYSSTYNISVFDINSYIRVGIKYDDSSNAKNDVTDLSGYVFSEPVFVDVQAIMTGVPQVGSVLTASLSGYKESVHYQWQVGDTEDGEFTDIDGATYSEFTITEEYLNKYIRVAITVTESSRELVSVAWQVAEAGTYPEASGDHIYVTDMPRANLITSSVGYGGSVKYDTNISGGTISLKVDGERKYFMKGLGAHAAANMVYDVSDYVKYYHYNRFIAYLGLDFSQGSNGDGVIFKIYTAETYDGNNTVWKNVKTTGVLKGTSEAVYVDLDLTGV